jgi:dTDP-4-amino-4,6-dideoxygalactose transaminase
MIKFNDLSQESQQLCAEIIPAIEKVLHGGSFILGQQVDEFEKAFAEYTHVKHAIGVNSGSDALFLAVKSLGIGSGDEVITVAHTFISTVDAITRNNASPVFVDIDKDTYCMDVEKIEPLITPKTKAVLPVHIYGHPVDMQPILDLAQEYGLYVIEDASQSHGATYKGQKTGGIGHLGCFSFYPAKNLGAYGDAGAIVTDDGSLAERLRMMRDYGRGDKYHHDFVGINSRLDELQAAILRVKLRHLDSWIEKRRVLAEKYAAELEGLALTIPYEKDYAQHAYHLYVIRSKERQAIRSMLEQRNIATLIHYPIPVHKQKAYCEAFGNYRLPETEHACDQILSLPMYPYLIDTDIQYIAQAIRDCFKH